LREPNQGEFSMRLDISGIGAQNARQQLDRGVVASAIAQRARLFDSLSKIH